MGGDDQFASGGQVERTLQFIGHLPAKIIVRNVEDRLLAPVGINHCVFKVLGAMMRVRLQLIDRYRLLISGDSCDLKIFFIWSDRWNGDERSFGSHSRHIS